MQKVLEVDIETDKNRVKVSRMMDFNIPENLVSGNIAENFKLFKDEVIVFFEATETIDKPQKHMYQDYSIYSAWRMQIVLGTANKELQTRLLREELTLIKVIQLCQAVEQQTIEVDVVK
ncbi:Hypothetical protein CINCED_3A004116 [Cinara cedri]|uniref:Uncharacterized protein n=1 Tax=Cinara cedri TaxID=506608 RepID=A0A5E4NB74_9HEMI|nr:Hypothetical protein CINCED_3A004116 [Cinara cedri]